MVALVALNPFCKQLQCIIRCKGEFLNIKPSLPSIVNPQENSQGHPDKVWIKLWAGKIIIGGRHCLRIGRDKTSGAAMAEENKDRVLENTGER